MGGRPARRGGGPALAALCAALLPGCLPGGLGLPFILPEQRQLAVRDPARLPPVAVAPLPPPATVTTPSPTGAVPQEMTLDDAIRIALANARVVRVLAGVTAVSSGRTVYDPAVSTTSIDEQRAIFDPTVIARNTFTRLDPPVAFPDPAAPAGARLGGTRLDTYEAAVGVAKRTAAGGTVGLDVSADQTRTPPGGGVLNPRNAASATLRFSQPLLRGAGAAVNRAPIVVAQVSAERTYYDYKDAVQELVRGVTEAYWAVVFARTDVWARRQQVEQGQAAYARAEARTRLGMGNAAEVAQTRVSLANFRANLVTAEGNLLQREAALRNILGLPPTDPERIVPVTPPTAERVEPKWDALVKLAADQRPDIAALKVALEADGQQVLLARNAALPQLDASALYRWNGLGGEGPAGGRVSSGPGQFADTAVGLDLSVPLGLRQPRAALRRAELTLARDRANLDQGLHAAAHALAASVRNLSQFYEQYRAFRDTRAAARDNLEQQLAEFRAGRAIFLNVLQAISDWGNAVSAEAQALAQYNAELANLDRQTGTILEAHGVQLYEERFAARGPFVHPRSYPAAAPPGPNRDRYPPPAGPPEGPLERDKPRLPGDAPKPAPAPLTLPPPRPAEPVPMAAPFVGPPADGPRPMAEPVPIGRAGPPDSLVP